ncbi:uncharacterized protein LOC126803210 [Argentina anserina]|uniref:uncharacterized protein LOC126803210 n=1 Tax=Argentina anserina TaxID=57926 RepID=UPI0021764E10|nr:uncharacterized protein LOC126803210 [Potentilla anserina]
MAKAIYLLFAAALIALIVLSPSSPRHHGHHRRLGFSGHVPIFDPLVSKMERYVEENALQDQNHTIDTEHDLVIANDVEEAQQYLSETGNLNITMRLVGIFPSLDVEPKDGFVSYDELKHWIVAQAVERMIYRTRKVMAENDRDGDRAISFREYLPQFSTEDIDRNEMGHEEAGWWKQQFDNADADRNGLLTFNELKDFLHPEDSSNDRIHKWLLTEKMQRMDHDHDGKLNFVEFLDNAYDVFKNYVEFETGRSGVPIAEEKFAELDVNKDKFLEAEELRPILHYLSPGELTYATYFTSFLIHEADDNKDGKLTLQEMLQHEDVFYNTVYESSSDDDSHDDHDEF